MATKIIITLDIDNSGMLHIERGDLGTMISIPANGDLAVTLNRSIVQALTEIEAIIANPPAEVKFPDPPKPAPAKTTGKSQTKTSAPTAAPAKPVTPVAPPPPPKPQRWWTNEDDGKVVRDDEAESKPGYTGPYASQSEAEANIPGWLKPAFSKTKSKR